jgi:FkbH-like protein
MTLNEALRLINYSRQTAAKQAPLVLICGIQPLHLGTFLQAHLTQRFPGERVEVATGLFGDLRGNIRRAAESSATTTAALLLEWGDLDPRLGLRSSGGWGSASRRDIAETVRQGLREIAGLVKELAQKALVAIAGPSLPLMPIGHTGGHQATSFELGLRTDAAAFLEELSNLPGVRVLDTAWLSEVSPEASRLDPKMALLAGFPYSAKHADALAGGLVDLLWPVTPKKGLIVDLDNTLWSGIVGEAGPEGVSWSQDEHSQVHALLQQMLALLAENGVLLAIASKNEPAVADQALSRRDILVARESFFPVVANWGSKSASVNEILRAWNVGADSVVFLDDSPMELSEVETVHPEITAIQFPGNNPAAVWQLLLRLRSLFGKPSILAEDSLRTASVRSGAEFQRAGEAFSGESGAGDFLPTLGGCVTIDYQKNLQDKRPLELINKTNQFNLNGVRVQEGEWRALIQSDETIVTTVSYEDRFGPLGKIAVLLGEKRGEEIQIHSWVMSCRAFSRRIEHHTLDSLFRVYGAHRLRMDVHATDRNQPLQKFLDEIGVDSSPEGGAVLTLERFAPVQHNLPHRVSEILNDQY